MKMGRPPNPKHKRRTHQVVSILTDSELRTVERLRGEMPRSLWLRGLIYAAAAQAERDARKAA